MTPEAKIKAKLRRELRKIPKCYVYMPVGNGMGAPALDYYINAGGWFIAVETKAPGKKPTPRQENTIAEIRKADGLVYVVDDDTSMNAALDTIRACCTLAMEIRRDL